MKYSFLLFGALFGFLLSRAGATTYDFYAKLFLFQDFQLVWVIGAAVVVGAPGIALLKRPSRYGKAAASCLHSASASRLFTRTSTWRKP